MLWFYYDMILVWVFIVILSNMVTTRFIGYESPNRYDILPGETTGIGYGSKNLNT